MLKYSFKLLSYFPKLKKNFQKFFTAYIFFKVSLKLDLT